MVQLTAALLSYSVHLNKKNKFQSCPLHIATRMGHDQIVRLLLKAGCDVNIESHQGLNALTIAASCNNLSVARLLLEHRAHIQDVTLIFASLHENGAEMCRTLLNHGANVNATDEFGNTALMQSAVLAHEQVVTVLASREWTPIIEVNKQNQYGWSALHFAYSATTNKTRERAKANTINILLKKGANIQLNDNEGKKPQDVTPQRLIMPQPAMKRRRMRDGDEERINKNLSAEFNAVHALSDSNGSGNEGGFNAEESVSNFDREDDPYDNYSPPDPKKKNNKRRRRAPAKVAAKKAPLRVEF